MRTRCYLAWALVASCVAGCGDNGPTVPLTVDVTNMPRWMEVGDSVRLEAVAREWDDVAGGPVGPPVQGVEFTWTSSAPAIVSVDASGLAVAHARGVADIEVCVPGWSCGAFGVVVVNPVAGVRITPDTISVLPHGRHTFEAILVDAAGETVVEHEGEYWWFIADSITWTSADPSVAVLGPQSPEDYV